jgi:predicted enzyme related to lactoylglutathione lyase
VKNSINWFEIPTRNMDTAVAFYEKTLGVTLRREVFGGDPHAAKSSAATRTPSSPSTRTLTASPAPSSRARS